MDFNDLYPLNSTIRLHPKEQKRISKAPDGSIGLEWTNLHGFIAVHVFRLDCVVDGMNEKGLSFAYLWMDGAEYCEVPPDKMNKALAFENIGAWILGNFSTVEEVKENLPEVFIWGYPVQPLGLTPPLHISLHDAAGNSLVIEFIQGHIKTYDNFLGLLTNDPPFEIQIEKLEDGEPSRFSEIAAMQRFILSPKDAKAGILLAYHLLNRLEVPYGDLRELKSNNNKFHYTLWSTVKDLTNKLFYFRTYEQLSLRSIDLKKIDFTKNDYTPFLMHQALDDITEDITNKMQSNKG
jgi:choloylglycine hydrolase